MKIKIVVSPDGKKSIVTPNKQQSSLTPSPVIYQNKDDDSDYKESIECQSELSEYEEAVKDEYAALHEPNMSEAPERYTDDTDGDTEMTDPPEEVISHVQISKPKTLKNQSAAGDSEAISKPAIGGGYPVNATVSAIATQAAFGTLESDLMEYAAPNKVIASAPTVEIGDKPNPDKPIPTTEVLSTPELPCTEIPTKNPNPSPVAYYDATYAFYVDGVYEFWSMGLNNAQISAFIKFLSKKLLEEQKNHILHLMNQVNKRLSWKRFVRKDGEAARWARDSAVLSSVYLAEMAGVTVENGKAVKLVKTKDSKVEGKNMDDWPLAWIHIREPTNKDSEIWMVGQDFTIDNMR